MMLDQVTPVVLALDEEANIGRTLEALTWARRVVVVDSGSTDATEEIVTRFPNAVFVRRAFDILARQWTFAVQGTGIATEWVLALDADYVLTPELVEEMGVLTPETGVDGFRAGFRYCVGGRPLRGSLYPPVTVLFRRARARYAQDGHAQRVLLPGEVRNLRGVILHDDRKPFRRFFASQEKYMRQEAELIASRRFAELRWPDRVRKLRVVAPFAVVAHCLFGRGLLLDGLPGLTYAFQRFAAEAILSRNLLSRDLGLRPPGGPSAGGHSGGGA
jgi:glycosyltransferase involved in cell wall biosynthesis